ncbi:MULTISPECIES: nitroreductase family deazaflavin-dependent oxidoreductase [unclassified Streptomyces]|uniref:nitroreductase family deazaflavin-dependent oxidoreductase n=1 Tax=unclassified Streptomyces TaxID=2593676 RepID=UPI001F040C95|nr:MULTISPECIES: nitroreductase family deazaflavin-dependent oxidoreductase [unclassified Streptomyces]MCH0564509.1 nitroreductase family deazaflavin-dependent oxidoreductase [Streptomyces sp. MUM 2J]MCH0572871.1 nitroreductase family deazaflavin-dependent oxidoreductase [Streptomyces sp. MUM 136J]
MAPPDTSRRRRPRLPRGWRRTAARLPILAFRAGLAPLFRQRLLLLHHVGRTTGLDRQVVLEVVTRDPDGASWTVASGFGPSADWYLNLRRRPHTLIQVGNRHIPVTAHFLSAEDGDATMASYAQRHPRTARRLCAFMGFPVDGSAASFRAAGRLIPFVRLAAAVGHRPV